MEVCASVRLPLPGPALPSLLLFPSRLPGEITVWSWALRWVCVLIYHTEMRTARC